VLTKRFSPSKLRKQREVAGLSREALAVAIDRSWQSVYQYERGRVLPSTEALLRLASALGCELDELCEEVAEQALAGVGAA
jgi:ribosome-binding protein aMBF1 (putative translation factor)